MDAAGVQVMNLLQSVSATAGDGDSNVVGFAICLIVSVVFGLLLQALYFFYFHDNEPQDGSLARSLLLLTPALTATFWMIQSSLVLSLGLLGSLSFVRFRTPIKRAEDISFVIIALAVAIACATGNFVIAGALVGLLYIYTISRNFFMRRLVSKDRFAVVTFNTKKGLPVQQVTEHLAKVGVSPEFVSSRAYDGVTSMVFNARKVSDNGHDAINTTLHQLDGEAHVNVFYPNERLGA